MNKEISSFRLTTAVSLSEITSGKVSHDQVFKNEDGRIGEIFLCSNDSKLNSNDMTTIYHKRWKVEEFHKSLKQNASLALANNYQGFYQIRNAPA